jgi:hypothetical protein
MFFISALYVLNLDFYTAMVSNHHGAPACFILEAGVTAAYSPYNPGIFCISLVPISKADSIVRLTNNLSGILKWDNGLAVTCTRLMSSGVMMAS